MSRVLFLSPSAKPGGAERVLANLVRELPELGFEPHAVVLEEGPLEQWLADAGCSVSLVDAGRPRHSHRAARTINAVRRLAVAVDGRIVVSNMDKGHVYGGLAALAAGIPAVWWQHCIPRRTRFELVAARVPAAAVACVCEDAVATQTRLTPRRRVLKIENGVACDAIAARRGSGAAVRKALGWEQNPVVGIVGRLQPWKGQDVFLRAAALVAKTHPEARFAVVGGAILGWEGSYPDDLRRLSEQLGLREVVRFAGHQPDALPWLDALDVDVLASLGDVFPLVLLEAIALGKAVVATAAGGPAEIVQDGRSGLLVPPGDHRALAGAITRLLEDEALASRLERGASERARDSSDERMARRFADVLRGIVDRNGSRARLDRNGAS